MRIIQEGNIKKTKTFHCEKCGCIFEADKGEYRVINQTSVSYYYCNCPTCKNTVREIEDPSIGIGTIFGDMWNTDNMFGNLFNKKWYDKHIHEYEEKEEG